MSGEGAGEQALGELVSGLRLDTFAREALSAECERLGISPRELIEFAIAYYLADLDSGRIARRVPGPRGREGP